MTGNLSTDIPLIVFAIIGMCSIASFVIVLVVSQYEQRKIDKLSAKMRHPGTTEDQKVELEKEFARYVRLS